jgi:hypothetical protein
MTDAELRYLRDLAAFDQLGAGAVDWMLEQGLGGHLVGPLKTNESLRAATDAQLDDIRRLALRGLQLTLLDIATLAAR